MKTHEPASTRPLAVHYASRFPLHPGLPLVQFGLLRLAFL